jgi:hypothetical protein
MAHVGRRGGWPKPAEPVRRRGFTATLLLLLTAFPLRKRRTGGRLESLPVRPSCITFEADFAALSLVSFGIEDLLLEWKKTSLELVLFLRGSFVPAAMPTHSHLVYENAAMKTEHNLAWDPPLPSALLTARRSLPGLRNMSSPPNAMAATSAVSLNHLLGPAMEEAIAQNAASLGRSLKRH